MILKPLLERERERERERVRNDVLRANAVTESKKSLRKF